MGINVEILKRVLQSSALEMMPHWDDGAYEQLAAFLDSDRKRMEEALRDSEQRFRSAFDFAPIGMALVSPDERWLRINRAFTCITGYSQDELRNMQYQDLTHPEDRALEQTFLSRLLRQEIHTYQMEIRYLHKNTAENGRLLWVQLNVSPVGADDGAVSYFIVQIQDITDRKHAEAMLRKAKEAAEAAAASKAEFLATISHEVRTPMNAVLGMATVLGETPLSAEQCELVETIKSGSGTLLSIMNDILDFSKIESGRMELEQQPFEVAACIEECVSLFSQNAQEKGVSLTVTMAPAVPRLVLGDSNRLRQILVNLLSNALKFTEQGHIEVLVGLNGSSSITEYVTASFPEPDKAEMTRTLVNSPFISSVPEAAWTGTTNDSALKRLSGPVSLLFQVRDTGCGIPCDKLRIIFESFTQVTPAISRKYGGTGLGLAICNRLLQLMGGRIWVESKLGKGSTFYFSFPTREVSEVSWTPAETPAIGLTEDTQALMAIQHPLKILVAEDNPTNQKLILHILQKMGYAPTLVENGAAVLKVLEGERYDILLMDIQMPEMDGLEAARQIVRRYLPKDRPRMLAMTAFGMHDDRARCLAAGMDDYICKPLSLEYVQPLLRRWAERLQEEALVQIVSLDVAGLRSRIGSDIAAMKELTALFSQDVPRLLHQMEMALSEAKLDLLKQYAHELKGVCMVLNAGWLRHYAAHLEAHMRDACLDAAPLLVEALWQEFYEVRALLTQLNAEIATPCA